jgi:hypothetical protein
MVPKTSPVPRTLLQTIRLKNHGIHESIEKKQATQFNFQHKWWGSYD